MIRSLVWFFVLCSLTLFTACNEAEPDVAKEQPEATVRDGQQLYTPSELALFMRQMNDTLKWVKKRIKHDSFAANQDKILQFAEMVMLESTPGMIKDQSHFEGYATHYLQRIEELRTDPNVASFNGVVEACITCHQTYCSGPLERIGKLTIK